MRWSVSGANKIFAAKNLPYMPTKEELRRELKLEEFEKRNEDY